MKKIELLSIDDYPTPVRSLTLEILKKKYGHTIHAAYFYKNGQHENRKWDLNHDGVIGLKATISALKKAKENNWLILYEPTLTSSVFFLVNVFRFSKLRWLLILAHLPTDGIQNYYPKNIFRKLLSLFSSIISDGNLFISNISNEYCFPVLLRIFKKPTVIGYGTKINSYVKIIKLNSKTKKKKIILLIGDWNERKRFDLVASSIFDQKKLQTEFEIHHVGNAFSPVISKYPFVHFHGYISNSKKLSTIRRKSYVSFLLSTREPWGHVVIENLAEGLLTFTSKNCGSNDVIHQINPRLILENVNSNNIISALYWYSSLKEQEIINLKKKGLALSKKYGLDNYAKSLQSLILMSSK